MKRERRQPKVMEDLPYLHWEKTGSAPAGAFAVRIAHFNEKILGTDSC